MPEHLRLGRINPAHFKAAQGATVVIYAEGVGEWRQAIGVHVGNGNVLTVDHWATENPSLAQIQVLDQEGHDHQVRDYVRFGTKGIDLSILSLGLQDRNFPHVDIGNEELCQVDRTIVFPLRLGYGLFDLVKGLSFGKAEQIPTSPLETFSSGYDVSDNLDYLVALGLQRYAGQKSFEPGMSGTGAYSPTGELVGIATQTGSIRSSRFRRRLPAVYVIPTSAAGELVP